MHRIPRRAAEHAFVSPARSPYDQVGSAYAAYADGHSDRLLAFDGLHAYADKCVWAQLSAKLRTLRAQGATSVSILDAGCGPGTWLCRLVAQAHWLGFTDIRARGFDVAELQVAAARKKGRALARLPGVTLVFDVADLLEPLPEADASVDLTVCLYSVLSHLPREALPKVAAEFARVTRGHFITTVRAVGSTPTIFVDSLENARSFRQDHAHDRCTVELANGAHLDMPSHLYSARELASCFSPVFEIEDLSGLDLFHGRFTPDRRWNPAALSARDDAVEAALVRLEETYAHDKHLIDRANHLLLVARSRAH
ncbi:MAG TPA: class I SAM-dependent methyltransferase [Rhizomicrobium sp.]|nr:class I SAM-dependent methyltransferase [Rhizomicrobium sp.]